MRERRRAALPRVRRRPRMIQRALWGRSSPCGRSIGAALACHATRHLPPTEHQLAANAVPYPLSGNLRRIRNHVRCPAGTVPPCSGSARRSNDSWTAGITRRASRGFSASITIAKPTTSAPLAARCSTCVPLAPRNARSSSGSRSSPSSPIPRRCAGSSLGRMVALPSLRGRLEVAPWRAVQRLSEFPLSHRRFRFRFYGARAARMSQKGRGDPLSQK
jgi:hypothetical protein